MIPSLLQIPSAVSDSKLHSVLPNNGKGDFTFDRSTGATRINKDGLIEEVGYFSSELVQNGNFSELGSELIVNGDFATNSDWTLLGTGWSINNGKLVGTIVSDTAFQAEVFSTGKTYKIVFTISDYEQGIVRPQFAGGGATRNGTNVSANGTYTQYLTATHNHTSFRFKGLSSDGGFTGKIDNVSVKQVDPNNRWSVISLKYTNTNVFENTATNGRLFQTFTTIVGSKYKVSATVNSGTWNIVASTNDNTGGSIVMTGDTTTSEFFEFTATTTTTFLLLYNIGASGSVASITDASVVEVQGDRPRLSYDITNGVVEKQPHLLLEPSSTNLVKFSENFTQWTLGSNSILTFESDIEAPDGTLGVYRLKLPATGSTFIQSNSFASSNPLSVSIYAKATGTGNNNFNLYTGGSNISSLKTATNKWQRFEYTASGTDFFLINSGDSFITDIYIWGAQAEALGFATSLIPTAGTTITRAAESSFLHNIDDGILNQSGFTLFLDTNLLNDTVNNFRDIIALYNTAGSITMRLETRTNGQVYIQQTGVVSSGDNFNSATFGSNSVNFKKFAISCSTTEVQLWADGNKINDYSGSYVFTFDKLGFRGNDSVVETILKHKGVAIYNDILSESQLFQLTGVTASSIYNNFVTRTASFTVEALNEVKKVIDNL